MTAVLVTAFSRSIRNFALFSGWSKTRDIFGKNVMDTITIFPPVLAYDVFPLPISLLSLSFVALSISHPCTCGGHGDSCPDTWRTEGLQLW